MWYIIDPFAKPALVVHISRVDDDKEERSVRDMAQRYADASGHGIVIAEGPEPARAQFSPTVPDVQLPLDVAPRPKDEKQTKK